LKHALPVETTFTRSKWM